jgi:YD repeat-containing protein
MALGNGLAFSQVWTDGRLASKRLLNASTGTDLSSLAYSYDPNDNIGSIVDLVDGARSAHYGYDANDRMAFVSMTVGAPANDTESNSYTVGTNRLASVATASGTRSATYDARGNTLSTFRPGVAVAAGYDGHGRLVSYARTNEPDRANSYNGLDERVKVTTSDGWDTNVLYYVYDLDHRLIGEYGATGAAIAETIWLLPEVANDPGSGSGAGLPIGGDDGVGGFAPLAIATGSGGSAALYWVHGNHLGVPLVTTNASGAAVTPTGYTLPGYPGQQRTLPDLHYNRHRDCDSSTGRYLQADPLCLGLKLHVFRFRPTCRVTRLAPRRPPWHLRRNNFRDCRRGHWLRFALWTHRGASRGASSAGVFHRLRCINDSQRTHELDFRRPRGFGAPGILPAALAAASVTSADSLPADELIAIRSLCRVCQPQAVREFKDGPGTGFVRDMSDTAETLTFRERTCALPVMKFSITDWRRDIVVVNSPGVGLPKWFKRLGRGSSRTQIEWIRPAD